MTIETAERAKQLLGHIETMKGAHDKSIQLIQKSRMDKNQNTKVLRSFIEDLGEIALISTESLIELFEDKLRELK